MTDNIINQSQFVIGTIRNSRNEKETVNIVYLPSLNSFITEGIFNLFGEKEILIPACMIIKDTELVGAIIATILEDMSARKESEMSFDMAKRFELFGHKYILEEKDMWIELTEDREDYFEI